MCISLRFCKHFFATLNNMAETKPPDNDLELVEISEGMAQELSRFREKLNRAKARLEELQTQLEELTSTDGIKGEYDNYIII